MMKKYFLRSAFVFAIGLTSLSNWAQTTFNYTGAMQTYTVPAGVNSIQIECWGASGGEGHYFAPAQPAGLGGYSVGALSVTPGQVLNIYVGGEGTRSNVSPMQGGFNGGGDGYNLGNTSWYCAGGGGASDVRVGGTALADRVIVAGGGGGGGGSGSWGNGGGGDGGGTVGDDGYDTGAGYSGDRHGKGGTQSAGGLGGTDMNGGAPGLNGSLGLGGDASNGNNTLASGGGGGYYGGGGGSYHGGGGGGGSSYIGGVTSGSMTSGVNTGHGQIIITQLCTGLTTTVSATSLCEGESLTLSASSIGSGTVTWDNGVVDNVSFVPALGTVTYTATSTDLSDCAFSVDVTVHPNPTVDAGVDIILCDGIVDTTLTASGTADSFTWDNGVTDDVQFTPSLGTTIYTVTAENVAGGCQATDMLTLIAGSPSITLSSNDEMFGNDGSVNLTIGSGVAPFTFDWDNDGVGDNNDNNDLFGVPAGTYTVIMTDASGCSTTETITVGSQLGITTNAINANVYPNPTNGNVSIELTGSFSYVVFDALGQTLITNYSNDKAILDLSAFGDGIYLIQITQNEQSAVVRVVKN